MTIRDKGNLVELKVTMDDFKLTDVSKKFLKDIEKHFLNFKKTYSHEEERLKKYIKSDKYIYSPESLSKQSPLAIINAPWGTGKTFFIENFLNMFIDETFSSKIFQRMLIIDAWRFSNSKDVPLEFMEELTMNMSKFQDKKIDPAVKSSVVKKMLIKIVPTTFRISAYLGLAKIEAQYENNKNGHDKEVARIWKGIEKNKVPTIIFIDNLERLGSYSWDLLKAVIKLQEFPNYLIVLTLNLNMLRNNTRDNKNEYPIEKYTDFNIYNFTQDYSNYFMNNGFLQDMSSWLSSIFNEEIEGEKMSIREIDKSFTSQGITNKLEDYALFKLIIQKIWPASKTINGIITNDIQDYCQLQKEKSNLYIKIGKKLLEKDNRGKLINVVSHTENKIGFLFFKSNQMMFFLHDKNYEDLFKHAETEIEKKKDFLKKEIAKNKRQAKSVEKKIEKNNERITELRDDVEKAKAKLKIEEKDLLKKDAKTIVTLKDIIISIKKNIFELVQENNQKKTVIDKYDREVAFIKGNISKLYLTIGEDIEKYINLTKKKTNLSTPKISMIFDYVSRTYSNGDYYKHFNNNYEAFCSRLVTNVSNFFNK